MVAAGGGDAAEEVEVVVECWEFRLVGDFIREHWR